ncbi:MAG: hypothetical protein JRI50_10360 [Deltaproteobacteria bacterium]|nr:hypothetical protein [Deltaproteobacteria bacterium]MBW2135798.1 hypothetical protein [Deltaproteobacteria bacterium]
MTKNIKQVLSPDHVGCFTDRYLIGVDERSNKKIYLISLFGTKTRVDAVKATILCGQAVFIQNCWTEGWAEHSQVRKTYWQYRTITRQLAPGVAHCLIFTPALLVPESKSYERVFWGESQEEILKKFFYAAQKYYSTPLLPEWTEWLWNEMDQIDIEFLGFKLAVGVKFYAESFLETRLFEENSPIAAEAASVN